MASNPSDKPIEWVSPEIIRQIFNERKLFAMVEQGLIRTKLKRNSHPESPPKGEPVCTRSQMLYYYDQTGALLAVVHQYLRRDGTIGASGLPDPKRLYLEDRIISTRTEPKTRQK